MSDYQTCTKEEWLQLVHEQFVPECESRGLNPILKQLDDLNLVNVKSANGVKTEIKWINGRLAMIAGVGVRESTKIEDRQAIKDTLESNGRYVMPGKALIDTPFININDFFTFLQEIEEIDSIQKNSRLAQYYKDSYNPIQIARRYFFAHEFEDQGLLNTTRNLLSADSFDKDIAINTPSETRTYREHIVPCIKIHVEVCERVRSGNYTLEQVAEFIKDNLKIAYIDPEDRKRIDFEYGWLTDMPKGWNWGDSITARLDESNTNY